MPQHVIRSSGAIAGSAFLAVLGCLPIAGTLAQTTLAQTTTPRPGEVPYLNYPPVTIPGSVPRQPSGTQPQPDAQPQQRAQPKAPAPKAANVPPAANGPPPKAGAKSPAPAALPASATTTPSGIDTLTKPDQGLAAVQADQKRATENEARLRREIETIGDDRRKLNQQLIDTAARVRSVEGEIATTEGRIGPLDEQERNLRNSLDTRRGVIAEILAAMQRIGRRPPPAILVRPEDALQSLRSAMLLGAVLPEMRQETNAILTDLSEMVRLRYEIGEERKRLERDLKTLADESPRLALLIEQRRKQQTDIENSLAGEHQRTAQLARQAGDLQGLIATLERAPDSESRPGRAIVALPSTSGVGLGAAGPAPGAEKKSLDGRPEFAALKDPGRLSPAIAFAAAKKQLPLPVNGAKIREFGAADRVGGTEKGLSIAARPGTQVTAPCDGWVVFAGPFRNYGQLLILNAGGGYHVLLAGMEHISVDLGQFVVTGEPVAVMGGRVQATAATNTGPGQPVLYVEFRKDGVPVDPGPWWAAGDIEKVRG